MFDEQLNIQIRQGSDYPGINTKKCIVNSPGLFNIIGLDKYPDKSSSGLDKLDCINK